MAARTCRMDSPRLAAVVVEVVVDDVVAAVDAAVAADCVRPQKREGPCCPRHSRPSHSSARRDQGPGEAQEQLGRALGPEQLGRDSRS